MSEVDFLAERVKTVDFAFVNVTGCHAHDPERLREGTFYTLDKLHPVVMVPTHGLDREYQYAEWVDIVKERALPIDVISPQNRGDHFVFRGGAIVRSDGASTASR